MGTAVKISSAFLPAGTNLLIRLPENAFIDNGKTGMPPAKSIGHDFMEEYELIGTDKLNTAAPQYQSEQTGAVNSHG